MIDRQRAQALDDADPLAGYRSEFAIPDPELIYLDGNSLGRLPRRAATAMRQTIDVEWGDGLVRSWHDWLPIAAAVGDALAPLIGAHSGEVLVCDQTSVNLYKLAWAGLAHTGRRVVVGDDSNFPSDRYVLRAVAGARGGSYREVAVDAVEGPTVTDLEPALGDDVGLVSLSLVSFKSAAIADAAAITELVHAHGGLVLWDLSHAAGAIPVELDRIGADLAVGCTYKFLNGGPGAPAFLYVRGDLQRELHTPIPGWFGHDDMFAFDGEYRPAPGIRRFAIGTPPVVSLRGVEAGVAITAEAGLPALRRKSVALTELLVERAEQRLAGHGVTLASPRDPARRASHVSLRHPAGYGISQALIARGVIGDFRTPDVVRLGVAPLYNRHVEMWDAVEVIAEVLEQGEHERVEPPRRGQVT